LARVAVPLVLLTITLVGCSLDDDEADPPRAGDVEPVPWEREQEIGFSVSATRNTVRVGGADAASDAAAVAAALFPATGERDRPTAVALVDADDWVTGIAGSVLAGSPIGAPLLVSNGDELPPATEEVLARLDPKGSDLSRDAQVIRIGSGVARPEDFKTAVVQGDDPFERAAAIDRFFSAARGEPSENVVLYSADSPEWAMPAAAWGGRSGDAVLPVRADAIPRPIREALEDHERPRVFLLGPERVISGRVARTLERERLAVSVDRIAGPTPVENAIRFARYRKGDFGWRAVVPGYNFSVASTSRPLDAAAAAALATRGVFAPLLLTDDAAELPAPLEQYFLSVQPGYEDDPGDAVYNRAWILGDEEAVSVRQQAQIDRVTELIPVRANVP
jgi:ell wall binding domain 2 (CWB2)